MQMLPSAAQRYRLGIAFSSSLREYKVFHMFALAAAKEQIITTQSAHVTNEPSRYFFAVLVPLVTVWVCASNRNGDAGERWWMAGPTACVDTEEFIAAAVQVIRSSLRCPCCQEQRSNTGY